MSESQVVFFGAGKYAVEIFEAANKKYAPVAYGDNDPKKQGTRFMGLDVLSVGQIEARHPGCRYYLTVDVHPKLYVTESLLAAGIDRSRIINFGEYKRYKSCFYLEYALLYRSFKNPNVIHFCCSNWGKNQSPAIQQIGNAYDETMREFYATRDRIIEELNSPTGAQCPCMGCHSVKEDLWFGDRRVRYLDVSYSSFCNFKCSYCDPVNNTISDSCAQAEDAVAFLRFLKERFHIMPDTVIGLASGEISIHPLRDKILTEIQDNPCHIFTNASSYNKKIGELLSGGKSCLKPSIDAGTRETFAKIKGVDLFDRVCENLARYSLDGPVYPKYIVLPGVNDNERDVAGFIDLCGCLKIKAVAISRNWRCMDPFGHHTIDAVAYMLDELQRQGVMASLLDEAYSSAPGCQRRIEERLAELRSASQAPRPLHMPGGGGNA
jgi:hypothetical protein